MRFIGSALVIAAAAALGLKGVLRLRARVRALESLISALDVMKSEICDRLTPMPQLLKLLSEEAPQPAAALFKNAAAKVTQLGARTLSALWREALEATPDLLLTPEEVCVLTELGQSLGRYDTQEQRCAIEYAQRRLHECLKKAADSRDKNSKLSAVLGVSAGVFIVIVFI